MMIEIEKIYPDKNQPRKVFEEDALTELSVSILNHGVLMPILLRKEGGKYIIVAGERRWRAAKMAGLSEIPATVMEGTPDEYVEAAVIENIQRQDLTAIEEARAYKKLLEIHGSVNKVADRVGKSRPSVSNIMRLLKLPELTQDAISQRKLTLGQALMILGAPEPMQEGLTEVTIERGLSPNEIKAIYKPTEGAYEGYTPEEMSEVDMEEAQRSLMTKINGRESRFEKAVCPKCAYQFMVDG